MSADGNRRLRACEPIPNDAWRSWTALRDLAALLVRGPANWFATTEARALQGPSHVDRKSQTCHGVSPNSTKTVVGHIGGIRNIIIRFGPDVNGCGALTHLVDVSYGLITNVRADEADIFTVEPLSSQSGPGHPVGDEKKFWMIFS